MVGMGNEPKKLSGASPSMVFMDEIQTWEDLIKENNNLRLQNLQLRRANSRLKNRGRRLTRIILQYKEMVKESTKQKSKFRNRNHQGRSRR